MLSDDRYKSKRCTNCDVCFPMGVSFPDCPKCGRQLYRSVSMEPDADWMDSLWPAIPSDSPYPHPPNARLTVHEHKGGLFIKHLDLLKEGYRCLEPDVVVFVNQTFYELAGYLNAEEAWLVQRIETEFPDFTPEEVIGGDAAQA